VEELKICLYKGSYLGTVETYRRQRRQTLGFPMDLFPNLDRFQQSHIND
jgi:hypothetical protein